MLAPALDARLEFASLWLVEAREELDRWRKLHALKPHENAVEVALAEYWLREAGALMLVFTKRAYVAMGAVAEADPPITGVDGLLAELAKHMSKPEAILQAQIAEHGVAAMGEGFKAVGAPQTLTAAFTVKHPVAVDYADNKTPSIIAGMNSVTNVKIAKVIRAGIANGTSYQTVAKNLIGLEAGFAAPSPLGHIRSRGELIAVTEMGNAYVKGTLTAAGELKAAGLGMEKHWLPTGDQRVCPVCASNEAQGWIELDEHFPSGHDGPTAHPGCRCDVQTRKVATGGAAKLKMLPEVPPEPKGLPAAPTPAEAKAEADAMAKALLAQGKFGPTEISKTLQEIDPAGNWTPLKVTHLKQKLQKAGDLPKPVPKAPKLPKPAASMPPKPASVPKANAPSGPRGEFKPGAPRAQINATRSIIDPDKTSAGAAKNRVMQDIAKRLEGNQTFEAYARMRARDEIYGFGSTDTERTVSTLIQQWAQTSGDSNTRALAMQLAAHEEFGLSASARSAVLDHLTPTLREETLRIYASEGPAMRPFLRAMYENTQERFAAEGIKEVALYRGQALTSTVTPEWTKEAFGDAIRLNSDGKVEQVVGKVKGEVEVQLRPLSSFAPDLRTARRFSSMLAEGTVRGNMVFTATVPVENVVGTSVSGFGCLSEWEMVVLEAPGKVAVNLKPVYGAW